DDLREMIHRHWTEWYGETVDGSWPLFWAAKLHFYLTYCSFYNFPYSIGYLLAQGLFRQFEESHQFFERYRALLLDTGRMSVEEIVAKHYSGDATDPEFWARCAQPALDQILDFASNSA